MEKQSRIAVIGSGIAGLSAAWLLSRHHAVTLFEAAGYLGGHTNTVDVTLDGVTEPVDTGFLVFSIAAPLNRNGNCRQSRANATPAIAAHGPDTDSMRTASGLESPSPMHWACPRHGRHRRWPHEIPG